MTELLYLNDCYQRIFGANIIENRGELVILDRTLFYPTGGGQPCDKGTLNKIEVIDVRKIGSGVGHYLRMPLQEDKVSGMIDWNFRYKIMRMHTAQHLISSIVLDIFDAETAGNQIGFDVSRIDFFPLKPSQEQLEFIENEFNKLVDSEINVRKYFMPRQQVLEQINEKRRNLFNRLPGSVNEVRVVEIEGIDKCPCGGTHVDNLLEIGHMKILRVENKGANKIRITFEII